MSKYMNNEKTDLVFYLMRKVVGDSYIIKIIDSGLLFRPIKFNDLYSLKVI